MKTLAFLGKKTKQNNEDFVYFPFRTGFFSIKELKENFTTFLIKHILPCTFHLFKILVISAETSTYLVVLGPNSIVTRGAFDPVRMDFNRRCRNQVCLY